MYKIREKSPMEKSPTSFCQKVVGLFSVESFSQKQFTRRVNLYFRFECKLNSITALSLQKKTFFEFTLLNLKVYSNVFDH